MEKHTMFLYWYFTGALLNESLHIDAIRSGALKQCSERTESLKAFVTLSNETLKSMKK